MPKRTSLPSMLPPAAARSPSDRRRATRAPGCRPAPAHAASTSERHEEHDHRDEQRPALPRDPDHLAEREAQRRRDQQDREHSRKFDSGVGFSNGCAEFTLKKPPPLVPSCLIAICDAAGPSAMRLLGRPRLPSASVVGLRAAAPSRSRRRSAPRPARRGRARARSTAAAGCRASIRVRSTQKLPIVVGVLAREAADQRDQHRHAGRRRHEVLHA